jgi:cyclic beta-1,2-glucan synthetase
MTFATGRRGQGGSEAVSPWDDGAPIRGEIFSVERLEAHGRSLAASQSVKPGQIGDPSLSRRLAKNEATLIAACRDVASAIEAGAAITPPAEWLIDNFYVAERQIRDVRNDLPPGYYRQLPKLVGGFLAGYPRVLSVAWGFVAHTDSLFDPEMLRRYLRAFQSVQPLTIGELWAIAITLRLVLVENLSRIALRVQDSRDGRRLADDLADRLLGTKGKAAESSDRVLAQLPDQARSAAFFVQLVHRLREQDPSVAPALEWLDAQLAGQGTTADAVVRDEHQRQVAGSVTVKNIITSMRLISTVDWSELFETISPVDDLFNAQSAFADMDFPTRNLYRTAVEQLARGSRFDELEITAKALEAAAQARLSGTLDPSQCDPGHALIGDGRLGFEAAIGFRPPLLSLPARAYRALGISGYVTAGGLVGCALLAGPLYVAEQSGVDGPWLLLLAVLGAIPALDLAVALVNHVLTQGYRATLLPALDLRGLVPEALRTLVAVPTFLTTQEAIADQVGQLEIHCLASPDGDLHFALLTDWPDADSEMTVDDQRLLTSARLAIQALNAKHGPAPGGDRFLLLHRHRIWNEGEGRWIGWERKRGKLTELNRLLRGATDTTFMACGPIPTGVRYVITLDADTRLPRETVGRLVGKMAHPLNHPRMDERRGRVVGGYAVLQPRVTPSLPVGRQGSVFLRVFSGAIGIDPYAAAVSDVYQDLFGEGSYTGKGIYDVDAFEAALRGRVPDSTLLSHDLFEGHFARAGLASDVEVVEDFPVRYDVAAQRHHRWARGDWQLLPWMIGNGPRGADVGHRGGVSAIGRWKMLDNLRRTLSAPSLVLALLVGWTLPMEQAAVWTLFVLATIILPPLTPVLARVFDRRPGASLNSHMRALGEELGLATVQSALLITFLAHQAWLMGDAIIRTLVRLLITRRHLLEWAPSAQTASRASPSLVKTHLTMAGALLTAAAALAVPFWAGSDSWPLALPFAAAWFLSPGVAYWASQSPRIAGRRPLADDDAKILRLIARRTWRYFEVFVTAANNQLPPDNFQETPVPIVARRTSPTNIGLYLLSVASARDFGWIGTLEAVERLEATFATLSRMATHRGHLLNWYDTGDLRPLEPQYVSSVDSGNLAGHLIALANACSDWRGSERAHRHPAQGIADALEIVRAEAADLKGLRPSGPLSWRKLEVEVDRLAHRLSTVDLGDATLTVQASEAGDLVDTVHVITLEDEDQAGARLQFWANAVFKGLESHQRDLNPNLTATLSERLAVLERKARDMAMAMDFAFLLDPDRLLLSIGFRLGDASLDPSCYDLLASEARLASFMAIAKRDVPTRHWFRLGRSVTPVAEGAALVSWSGSMFEYLMPSIVMAAPADSLIEQTNRLIVRQQIRHAAARAIPWGVSESAYNARDLEFTYQYSNFGLPGLGLKRGLGDNAVVAPYATALASMIDPEAAVRNFETLTGLGACGAFGFVEALDFTPERLQLGETVALVRAYMAHHQGMTITAIADTLLDGLMRRRFHAEPLVQATALLLQERVPRDVTTARPSVPETTFLTRVTDVEGQDAWRIDPNSSTPTTQFLSNGRYCVMLTAAGSGYSRWKDMAITRWREDVTSDDWGSYVYLRDVGTSEVWSASHQPIGDRTTEGDVTFNEDRAEFGRRVGTVVSTLQVLVSAEDDAEVRRITLTNQGSVAQVIEVTSYGELVLAPQSADVAHPAFSKLFVETEHLPGLGALLATRRRRDPSEPEVWAAHLVVVEGDSVGKREYETDRARFIGRGGSVRSPRAVMNGRSLSCTTGTVLDPIFSLRRRVRIAPGATARVDFWTVVGASREDVLSAADKHHDIGAFDRAAALAWTQAQVQLHHMGIDRSRARHYQRLAGHMIFTAPLLRAPSRLLESGSGAQSGLWSMGISGDLPILLVRVSETDHLELVKEALQAVEYWRMKRLAVDLVVLNERGASYVQDLQIALETLVRASQSRPQMGDDRPPGHIFMLRGDQILPEARALLVSVARVMLMGERGRLFDQLERAPEVARPLPRKPQPKAAVTELQISRPPQGVEYFNGIGGFTDGGREYLVVLSPGQSTPAPWINVIANAGFGFQVSTEGSGSAWSVNSREHQLTPWSNDPVTDRPGQALYIRDEDTGEVWTPTALPIRKEAATYEARHGWGYSRFDHVSSGIAATLTEFVPLADPLKISRLVLRNQTSRVRHLSVTAYVEWVLGATRSGSAPFTTTRIDPLTGAMLATNPWNPAFADRVAFADLAGRQTSWTGDRREFIGRNGALDWPAALAVSTPLSGRVGSGLDPCAALKTQIALQPNAVVEIDFFLGDAPDAAAAQDLIQRYRAMDLDGVQAQIKSFWAETVGKVQVRTPDRSMDIMLNGWLTYQTLSCRLWARSGFYQASGAYGFRDQLQDGMALASTLPQMTREHLLRAAGRQFLEGDVQHWWLPHSGQGVRTRISDDRVWLAYACAHYIRTTGDGAVLDEAVPYLTGPELAAGEADQFFAPGVGPTCDSLYEHCARALDASLAVGVHGAPLMGAGDWNDGMNRVGEGGRGESVWLGWLLHAALEAFATLAESRGDVGRAQVWRVHRATLSLSLEGEAWDGQWYRRGWFDDGAPLGSSANAECRIDAIAQSWAVLSGAGDKDRARQAMMSVERELVSAQDGLALLFTPPFDRTAQDPGYIKGYPPGLRENGGQYTHAALWSVMAFAQLGEGEKAAALFWMLNPINHARTRTDMHRYKVEPYVVAADVYSAPGHVGRGGWTWYTGAAGWMQRAGVESILGVRVEGNQLYLTPCVPADWPGYAVAWRHGSARYDIEVVQTHGLERGLLSAALDGAAISLTPLVITLVDDGAVHGLKVTLGA